MPGSPNRIVALVLGLAYLALGGIGFVYTTGLEFASASGGLILGLVQVNPLQNVLHLAVGLALLVGVLARRARVVNAALGAVLLLLGLWGLFLIGAQFNPLALNAAANVVHLASAVLLLAAGLGAERSDSVAR